MKRLDSHHHLWQVDRGDYHWMPDSGPLREDYLPDRLLPELASNGIEATILVQAAQTVEETDFLLEIASAISQIVGVTGWINLEDPAAPDHAQRLMEQGPLVAIRPMLHDLDDPEWIARPSVVDNLRQIQQLGLRLEILSLPQHLEPVYSVLEQLPNLPTVIDHLSKPSYCRDKDKEWRVQMSRIAQLPHVHCKISGMVTEVGDEWRTTDFAPYVEHALESFGPERLMFGSDWPVCRKVAEYHDVVELVDRLISRLAPEASEAFWSANARQFYGVAPPPTPPGEKPLAPAPYSKVKSEVDQ